MPEYLAPGVFVEEISTGSKPIEGVSTSVAGFLGPTERGPEDIRYITSWLEYQRWYGYHLGVDTSYMSYAVQGFFDNGGQRCFIGRIVKGTGSNMAFLKLVDPGLTVFAIGRGGWGNRVYVRIRKSSQAEQGITRAKDWVRITIYYYDRVLTGDPLPPEDPNSALNAAFVRPATIEDFDNLSLDMTASNSAVTAVNAASKLIRIDQDASKPITSVTTDPTKFLQLSGGSPTSDADASTLGISDFDGTDGVIGNSQKILFGQGTGLAGMNTVDEVSLLLAPDHPRGNLGDNLIDRVILACERLKDRFAVLSTPRDFPTSGKPTRDTTFGAQYFPWIKIYDPVTRDDQFVPPAGHVAGILARTDIEQGVHKAPANAVVVGAKDLLTPVTKETQSLFNPVGINCIRDFRSDARGIRLWGARTMSSDPEWKYVNVRRLFLFIEESIDEGTQWVVFEPNAPTTWARVEQTITNFLTTLWRNGALVGATRDDAFFVRCDKTTMTPDDIDSGRLICQVGVAPVKPAEFVIIRIGQKTADAQA